MWVSADADVNSLLHQESCPLFFVFAGGGIFFISPMGNENYTVADFFCLLNVGGHLLFVKSIDNIGILAGGQTVIGTVCIIQESDRDIVDSDSFDFIALFFRRVGSYDSDFGMIGLPVI